MVKILVIDEGTSSTRAAVFDENLTNGEFTQFEIPLISPSPHIVEQDANLIWRESYKAAKIAISNNHIDAIGITNQRETTILWNKNTGIPVHNAIIWQDRRGADFCDYLKNNNLEKIIINKTGLLADPYFSAFKIRYLLENIKGLRESVNRGEILFGNVDTWLIWNLTKGKSRVTDYSNASRSAIFNINEGTLAASGPNADAIIISDYNYGAVFPEIFADALAISRERGIPLVVDSRFRLESFSGATSATPNSDEVAQILGEDFSKDDCGQLCERLGLKSLLVTNGNRGVQLFESGQSPLQIDAVGGTEPVDVTGAGDTVIAAYTLGLASGMSYAEATKIANHAGGIVVMKKGTASVTAAELTTSIADNTDPASASQAN